MPDESLAEPTTADTTRPTSRTQAAGGSSTSWRRSSRLPAYLALGIAVLAAALAALAYFHPAHHGATGPAQQGGDAKVNVCAAFGIASKGVVINTHLRNPDNGPASELAVAANARLSLVGGGAYLHQRLAANTGAPAELIGSLNLLADTMQQLGAAYLAGATAEGLDPLRHDLDSEIATASKPARKTSDCTHGNTLNRR